MAVTKAAAKQRFHYRDVRVGLARPLQTCRAVSESEDGCMSVLYRSLTVTLSTTIST